MYNPTYHQQLNKVTEHQKTEVLVKLADAGSEFAAKALTERLKRESNQERKIEKEF